MSQPHHYMRIFLSSPGDVADERAIALGVLDQLPYDPFLRGRISLDVVAWDKPGADTPLLATITPQEAINQGLPTPSQCDIVVVLFWSRMGTPLPYPEYRKADGTQFLSGTEWEYYDAFQAAQETGKPFLVVYRRTERVSLFPDSPNFMSEYEQWQRVDNFFKGFVNPDNSIEHGYNQYTTPDEFRRKFETHIKVLIKRLIETAASAAEPSASPNVKEVELWSGSPFPGLRAFGPADAPIFFGRGAETDALLKRLQGTRFVAIVGASGSGKSSLVGAGLLPRLRSNALPGSKDWYIASLIPSKGATPFESLAAALIRDLPALAYTGNPFEYPQYLQKAAELLRQSPQALRDILDNALRSEPPWTEVLLFIDQFEELFAATNADQVVPFVATIVTAARSEKVRVVVTMRADFYHEAVTLQDLSELMQAGSFPLAAPRRDALRQMIERPAERAGLVLDRDLRNRILDDTGDEPGNLALMAYLLDELYQLSQTHRDKRITLADYEKLGGVQGAIGKRAETLYREIIDIDEQTKQQALFEMFNIYKLLSVDERGTVTRRRALTQEVQTSDAASKLIDKFTDPKVRLLIRSQNAQHVPTVEVAHEALLKDTIWPRVGEWVEQNREDWQLIARLESDANEWKRKPEQQEDLWLLWHGQSRRQRVQQVLARQKLSLAHLSEVVQEFLDPQRVVGPLLAELGQLETDHHRRLEIGEFLDKFGDSRAGVGLCNGLPDIAWCFIDGGLQEIQEEYRGRFLTHQLNVRPFFISQFAVTCSQFKIFLEHPDGFQQAEWWQGLDWRLLRGNIEKGLKFRLAEWQQIIRFDQGNWPRQNVCWYEAVAFCRWLTANLPDAAWPSEARPEAGYTIRLPAEWEWQRAATGDHLSWHFCWGTNWGSGRANTLDSGLGGVIAVGMYPYPVGTYADQAPLDMIGNVGDWCLNKSRPLTDVSLTDERVYDRVVRGGSWHSDQKFNNTHYRIGRAPELSNDHRGFRVVCALSPEPH